MPVTLIVLLVAAVAVGLWRLDRARRRRALFATPLSDENRAILAKQVPLLRKLPGDLRPALEGKINAFLEQVDFIGCDGLEITQEMRLSIAAQACLLVVNTDAWYANLRTILVYPGAFKSRQERHDGYVVTEEESVRLGESWRLGPVVLSWQHSNDGALDDEDGHNVVLHEFAHQLDDLSGRANGVPILNRGQSFADWETAFLDAFDRLQFAVDTGRRTVIDPYGAQGHEEFFAVTVELFFERPGDLRRSEPAVYEQLSALFRLDPESWD